MDIEQNKQRMIDALFYDPDFVNATAKATATVTAITIINDNKSNKSITLQNGDPVWYTKNGPYDPINVKPGIVASILKRGYIGGVLTKDEWIIINDCVSEQSYYLVNTPDYVRYREEKIETKSYNQKNLERSITKKLRAKYNEKTYNL